MNGKIELAIDLLDKHLELDSERNNLALTSARYNYFLEEQIKGILTGEEKRIIFNEIVYALLHIVDKNQSKKLLSSSNGLINEIIILFYFSFIYTLKMEENISDTPSFFIYTGMKENGDKFIAALKESYVYAINEIKRQFLLHGEHNNDVLSDFKKIEQLSETINFELNFLRLKELINAFKKLKDIKVINAEISIRIIRYANVKNASIQDFFIHTFAPLYLFSFKEIGLKFYPEANSIMTNGLLLELQKHSRDKENSNYIDSITLISQIDYIADAEKEAGAKLEKMLTKFNLGSIEKKRSVVTRIISVKKSFIKGFIFVWERTRMIGCYPCNVPRVTIGRQLDNSIVLPEMNPFPKTSRYHGELFLTDSTLSFEDKSKYGSFINNKWINHKKIQICWEDKIQIGPFIIHLTKDISKFPTFFYVPTD